MTRAALAVGVTGSVLIAASSWWIGAVPSSFLDDPPTAAAVLAHNSPVAKLAYYLGLGALSASWLAIGRSLLAGRSFPVARYALSCAAPLLLAMPFGRDLWAYAAQGNLAAHGLNPYTHGPADLPGAFTAEVSSKWLASTTPYGPLWVQISRWACWLSGGHPTVAALLLRLPAVAGLALWVWAIPNFARRSGGRADLALWLGAASPLALVLGVGGGHNDLLMTGLMVAAVAVAARGTSPTDLLVAGAILGLAVGVKSPALVAVAFTVPIWLRARDQRLDPQPVTRAIATVLLPTVAVFGVITLVSGWGLGWTKQASADIAVVNWLSLPTLLAMLAKIVTGTVHGATSVDAAMRGLRTAGEAVAAVAIIVLWWRALRGSALMLMTIALAALAVLAPATQPWYLCWSLAFAGLVITARGPLVLLAAAGVVFPVMFRPNGQGYEMKPIALLMGAGALAACWLALRAGSAPHDHRAEHAGAEVRTDDGAQL